MSLVGRNKETLETGGSGKKILSWKKQCSDMLLKGVVFSASEINSDPRRFMNVSCLSSEEQVQGERAERLQHSTGGLDFVNCLELRAEGKAPGVLKVQ